MAGITDGKFCSKMSIYGFDLLTIGGYNADKNAINAGLKIIKEAGLNSILLRMNYMII